MFSKRIISLLVVLSFISQTLVVVDTDSYSSVVVEDYSILEELSEQDGARTSPSNISVPFTNLLQANYLSTNVITNGKIMIFMADSANSTYGSQYKGRELHVSDGTLTGTSLLKDLNPGEADLPASNLGAGMSHVWWNDVLYFPLDDGTDEYGQELWRTDGTENGTYMVKDIREGSASSGIAGLTLWEDHLYFTALADTSVGYELWKSDGTENGTFILKDIYSGDSWDDSGWPRYFTAFNDKLYFQATDEEHGTELWTTDGTENGTNLVVDLRPGTMGNGEGYPSDPKYFTVFNDYMLSLIHI